MRLGYFGGTFDPPHRGHLMVARAAADRFGLDRVLLAPTGRQPLKPHGSEASFADRMAMVSLLAQADARLTASAIDAPAANGEPNYTVDTLQRLREEWHGRDPALQLFVIVGADAFASLPQWREPERLLNTAEWIVISRPGALLDDVLHESVPAWARARVHALNGLQIPVSATAVRERLHAGEPCGDLLLPVVEAYIRAHHLYEPGHESVGALA